MLILEGPQGTNKSSALRALAIRDKWFTDNLNLDMPTKELIEVIEGRLILEAPELNGLSQRGENHLKALLSRQEDAARRAYGKRLTEATRQSILIGTTNSRRYLRDPTGNRRFWPVKIQRFDLEKLEQDRDQLWAEASAAEARRESIRLPEPLWAAAGEVQEARRIADAWEAELSNKLGEKVGKITIPDLFVLLGVPGGRQPQAATKRLAAVMVPMGWESTKLRFGNKNPECCYAEGNEYERRNILKATWSPECQAGRVEYDHRPVAANEEIAV